MEIMPLARLLLSVVAALPVTAGAATEHPVRVTTDSSAYCVELANRFAGQSGTQPAGARSLAEEGQKLCESGYVRTGIAKLRRALRATQAAGN